MADIRHCWRCNDPITACNGFVLARDYLAMLKGEQIIPRELCGRCGVRMEIEVEAEGIDVDTWINREVAKSEARQVAG